MRTDTIFYELFLTFNTLLFELIERPLTEAGAYEFASLEVKAKAFRFDGIFMPNVLDKPIYFVEVQFQNNPDFYWELLAEIHMYLNQYKPEQDWKAVAIFAKRSYDVSSLTLYQQEVIASGRILRIYLDELPSGSLGIGLIQLIISKAKQAKPLVGQLIERTRSEVADASFRQVVVELLESILMLKFPKLSHQEIEAMFALSDLKQTRVYQEAKEEGKLEGRQNEASLVVLRQLTKRFGVLSDHTAERINNLSVEQLEELGLALLDFANLEECDRYLDVL
jgi:predicted transposase/invertase (TIGR01784 family)